MNESERTAQLEFARSGDAAAFQRLLVDYHPALRRRVDRELSTALRRRLEPEDVLQEAYVAAFAALRAGASAGGDGTGPNFGSGAAFFRWLEQIALNKLRDAERAVRRHKRDINRDARVPCDGTSRGLLDLLSASSTTPSRALSRAEAAAVMLTSLGRLPEDQRVVIRWRFLDGVPVGAIAQRMGRSEVAVYALCARGMRALRSFLDPHWPARPARVKRAAND